MKLLNKGEILYAEYKLSMIEYLKYGILGLTIVFVLSYIFFENFIAFFIMLPILIPYFKAINKKLCDQRGNKLKNEFMELCMSLAAQMSAGYSIESALKESYKELDELFDKSNYICKEIKIILEKLKINISIEEAMSQFAIRSNNEDIRLFSGVLTIAKRSGGDLIGVVKSAALSICEKTNTEKEITAIISEKKLEQMIMNIIPLVMVLYIKTTSNEMMQVMYRIVEGKIIMSICFIVYVTAFSLGRVITDIEV